MSFAKKASRRPTRSLFGLPRAPPWLLVRAFLMGLVAILGAAWALERHYTHQLPPMRVPRTAAPAPTYDADAGEIPVPEILEE